MQHGMMEASSLPSCFRTENFTQVATNMLVIFVHALYGAHQPVLNAKLAKRPPGNTSRYTMKLLFEIDKGHVHCLVDGIFL